LLGRFINGDEYEQSRVRDDRNLKKAGGSLDTSPKRQESVHRDKKKVLLEEDAVFAGEAHRK